MFQGAAMVSLDGKGRLVIPARHRALLTTPDDHRLVITADPIQCLMLYTLDAWALLQAKLAALSDFNPRTRGIKQVMLGYAQELELDSAGRVQLSPMLVEFAGLEKSVVLAGQGNRVELWDSERWKARIATATEQAMDPLPAELEGFTL